jgi:hypothetical protein
VLPERHVRKYDTGHGCDVEQWATDSSDKVTKDNLEFRKSSCDFYRFIFRASRSIFSRIEF